ncbi:MAG: FMN-binding negative transcriptional regulator [Mycobacterium sp.]
MYVPPANRLDDDAAVRALVAAVASAEFVTVGEDGFPVSTLLPILWEGDTVIAHMAKANPQWRSLSDGQPALLICAGDQAYISPTWYAAKAEHGRVVPTWNYSAVHLTGMVRVHDDPGWVRTAVERLTVAHESGRAQPWQITDAPAAYIEGQLRGIVGLEVAVQRIEAKAKLSQNRSLDDRRGVVAGLHAEPRPGAHAVADAMAAE